jgi:hypothetical protein
MIKKICVSGFMLLSLLLNDAYAQKKTLGIDDFIAPLGNWSEAGAVKMDAENERKLVADDGKGVFVNGPDGKTVHLITRDNHGDIRLELEFMVPKGSNSGVYLQGRYESQILDSWGREKMVSGDCGGIYQRWDENREGNKGFEGTPPPVNASKKPGEWQHLLIRFKAPRFNSEGEKVKNAVFKMVKLNGVKLHQNVKVTGPTRSSLDEIEEPTGPLMFQGDHGPVAFRNIRMAK